MDSQQIREALAADPYTTDEALIQAAQADAELRQYWQDMRQLHDEMVAATQIPVPAGLEAKLLQMGVEEMETELELAELANASAEQSANDNETVDSNVVAFNPTKTNNNASDSQQGVSKRSHYFQLAIAASVALFIGLGVKFTNPVDVPVYQSGSEIALAHVYHELDYLESVNHDVSLADVNAKLATFGGEMLQSVGRIKFANFCYFEKQKSLHLVLHTEQGDINLFVTPQDLQNKIDSEFGDENFEGRSWKTQKADITIIGDKGKMNKDLEKTIKNSMQFSA